VDLDPEDLDINLDYEDSYSVGDGVGVGHDGDMDEGDVEDFEIDEAFLHDLEEAEQQARVTVEDVIELDEDSQVEIQSVSGPRRPPGTAGQATVEEIIDISD
jgi:hypothetical protein